VSNEAHRTRWRRPTQVDLAKMAGVSQATVSQVLNETEYNPARISDDTRQRILAAAKELGYSANPVAQSLKGGRNFLLGFHTFENVFPSDQSDFYFPFLLGVESEAARRGYDLLLFSPSASGTGRAHGVRRLLMADGCILLGRHIDRDALAELSRGDFPFVFIGRREVENTPIAYVGADYATATESLVLKLAAAGHSRIGYIGEPGGGEQNEDRLAGFWRGVDAAGLREGSLKHSAPLTDAELASWRARGITAVLVEPGDDTSNIVSLERSAEALGLDIPGDLSVAVLGDPPLVSAHRDWTRFALRRTEIAETAVRLLLEMLEDSSGPRQVLVDCDLVDGVTVAPPKAGR
jgi:DNA-binding LacI/PurR family transcriptional regulator